MAQIVVRGIDDELMRQFKAQAKARGKSVEQAVRELIEQAAREKCREADWFAQVTAFSQYVREKYGEQPSSVDEMRADRDRL